MTKQPTSISWLVLLLSLVSQHANSEEKIQINRIQPLYSGTKDDTVTRQSAAQHDPSSLRNLEATEEDYPYLLERNYLWENSGSSNQEQQKERRYTFAVITKQNDIAYYDPVQTGCQEMALKLSQRFQGGEDMVYPSRYPPGMNDETIECLFLGPDSKQTQAAMVEELMWGANATTKIDGLAISVFDAQAMTPIINRVVEELRIPVVTFDSDASESKRSYYVGTNNTFFGTQLARAMETLVPNGGAYGVITASAPNMQERVQGILDELNHQSNWHQRWVLMEGAAYDAQYNLTRTFDKLEEWAQQNPAVLVATMGHPMMIQYDPITNTSYSMWKNFVEKHRHRNITFLCGDAMDHQLDFLQSNLVQGLVGQLPYDMGQQAIQTLWTLTWDSDAELGDPEDVEDGDDNDTTDHIGTNVISHVHIPLRLPPVQVDNNLVGDLKYIGFILYLIIGAMALGFAAWAFINRNVRVVRVAQPRFLMMIALGILILGSCMIPLGMDDGGGTRADCFDSSVELGEHCTAICMSVPWLASVGFVITFSALYSKTRRVNMIFHQNTAFGRVKVSERDVLVPFIVLLSLNVIILALWTFIDPLTYTRFDEYGRDGWNRVISTYGVCQSDNQEYFLVPLAIVNIGVLVLANWQAYEARDIEAEFSETKYIGVCMASMLQAMITGIPVLFIVKDLPQAYYVVLVLLIFIICMVILMVMFVPKIVFAQQFMAMSHMEQKQFMTEVIRRTAKSSSRPKGSKGSTSATDSNTSKNNHHFDFNGSHYTVQASPNNVQMSTLGMNGASTTVAHNLAYTDYRRRSIERLELTNGLEPIRSVQIDRAESTNSDDTGLVFFRKSCTFAMEDAAAAVCRSHLHQSSKQDDGNLVSDISNQLCDWNDETLGDSESSARANVHQFAIAEGDEEEGVGEEVKEEVHIDRRQAIYEQVVPDIASQQTTPGSRAA